MSAKEKIIDFVKRELSKSNLGAHTLDHTMRVYSLSMKLSKGLQINMRVLEAAALLHDVGRPAESESNVSHSILSGEMGKECLGDIGYTKQEIEHVVDAIRTHRFSEDIIPRSIEGQILSDADKLDAIGAVGVYRAIAQAAASGKGIQGFLDHADEKLLKLKEMMYTVPARELANERHEMLSVFVDRLRNESRIGTT
ncbi:MAG: HD domain-containing protein [Candidatus Thorarchaeota archaeon]